MPNIRQNGDEISESSVGFIPNPNDWRKVRYCRRARTRAESDGYEVRDLTQRPNTPEIYAVFGATSSSFIFFSRPADWVGRSKVFHITLGRRG